MKILRNTCIVILTLCFLTVLIYAQETNETIVSEINETITETNASEYLENNTLGLNETSNLNETTELIDNVTGTENQNTTLICSTIQCDLGCTVCQDGSCYSPETVCMGSLSLEKITPSTISTGEQQLNILLKNTGNVALPLIRADISGYGITTIENLPIENLAIGDKDYTFTKVNVSASGTIDLIIKIYVNGTLQTQQITQIVVSETILPEPETNIAFNSSAATDQLEEVKNYYSELEKIYYEKEKQEYIMYGVKEDLDGAKEALRLAQVAILDENQKEFENNLILANGTLTSVKQKVDSAQKEEKTVWQILYENLAVIGTVLGVIISIITVWSMTKVHLKKARIINVIKGKQIVNVGKKEEIQTIDQEKKTDSKPKAKDL